MGIRFFCHHCQSRLNVKSSQSGHPGVCPDCGGTVDVPLESLLPGSPKSPSQRFYVEEENPPEGSSQLINFDVQDTIGGDVSVEPAVGIQKDGTIKPPSPVFATTHDIGSGVFMLDSPSPSPDFGKVDPIETAPEKVWYFRSKELGERGPLKAKAMQQHVNSGDVSAGCMVWREDWDDWVGAEAAFPQIDPIAGNQPVEVGAEIPSIMSKRPMAAKQVVFYGAILAGLAVIAALGYVVVWIARGS